jgi:hypothetical protein
MVVDLADFVWIHITVFLDISLKSIIAPRAFPQPCGNISSSDLFARADLLTYTVLANIHRLDDIARRAQWAYRYRWL